MTKGTSTKLSDNYFILCAKAFANNGSFKIPSVWINYRHAFSGVILANFSTKMVVKS